MVLSIKNKHASFEDFAHLSHFPAGGISPGGDGKRLAKLSLQNLRNAGVPKAMSMPQINLLAEGGSLRAHCSAVLSTDLQNLKPGKFFARKVKSAKEDLGHLFNNASAKQPVDPAGDSTCVRPDCPAAPSHVGTPSSLDSSSSPAINVPALLDDQEDDNDDHLPSLVVVAQSWLDFDRLFTRRRALSDPTIEVARRDFCQALVQLVSDHSSAASPPQREIDPRTTVQALDRSHASLPGPSPKEISNLPSAHPAFPSSPSGTALTRTISLFESTPPGKLAQSPEFSDKDLERDFDAFSFDSSQEEGWTSEVESRKQNAFNRTLSDMKRKLAVPIPKLSSYFSDDSLADTAAQQTLVNPQASRSDASSKVAVDNSSVYSADLEDEADGDESAVVALPNSTVFSDAPTVDVDATIIPPFPAEPAPSSQTSDLITRFASSPRMTHIEDGTSVWQELAVYVPTLLTRISEESLADEYEIEATGQSPPLSFGRPISEYRKHVQLRRQYASLLDYTDQVDSTPAALRTEGTESSEATLDAGAASLSITTDTDINSSSSSVVSLKVSERSLRRVRKFADLKNPLILSALKSTSSIETLCDTTSLHEEACPPGSRGRRLRRVPGCPNLRKACGRIMSTEAPPSLSGLQGHSLQNLEGCLGSKGLNRSSDREEICGNLPVSPRCDVLAREDSYKPEIPPKPPGLRLHRKRIQLASDAIQEPSSLCSRCDPSSSLPLWSCAKIARSKGKQGRGLNVSMKALKKHLDSIYIDPDTVHGHPPQRSWQKFPFIPSIYEIGKRRTSRKTQTSESNRHG